MQPTNWKNQSPFGFKYALWVKNYEIEEIYNMWKVPVVVMIVYKYE